MLGGLWGGPFKGPPSSCRLLLLSLFLSLFPLSRGEYRGLPLGPTEEAEPYASDTRWGRAVRQKWEEADMEGYLQREIERVSSFEFWVDNFLQCLPARPEKERQRQDRAIRRKLEKNKGDRPKEGNVTRRHRSSSKLAAFEEWLQAYSQDPFGGLSQLPLQTEFRESQMAEKEAVLLQQLEEENAFGAFRIRYQHLKVLSKGTHKRVFTGEAPEAGASSGVNELQLSSKSRGGGPPSNMGGGPQGGALPTGLPEVNPNGIRMAWWDVAQNHYLPAIQGGPQGAAMGQSFLEELADAFDALDSEMKLRVALDSHQRLMLQQKTATAASLRENAAAGSA
ncbi:hypothetical protein Emed_003098 [Eimeria media]